MRILRDERGEGRGKFLITIIVVAFLAFCLYKFINARVRVFAFKGAVEAIVRDYANNPTLAPETISQEIQKKASEHLGFDLPEDNIKAQVQQDKIIADVNYIMPVNFPLYMWNWQQNVHYEFRRF
jgi:hypothetical protein